MKINITKGVFFLRKQTQTFIMRTALLLFCSTVFSFSPIDILSQNTKIVIDEDKTVTVDQIFDMIQVQTDYTFIYRSNMFKDYPKVHLKKSVIEANALLEYAISDNDYSFELLKNNTIVIEKKSEDLKVVQQIITGRVTNENNTPLAGATIIIKGTTKGVSSDFDGNYNISVSNSSAVLVFSSLGFHTQEITVGSQTVINVIMKESASELDEVVLIGYGKQKKRDVIGSTARATAKDIALQPTNNVLSALQGAVPGLEIFSDAGGQPGSPISVRIRGINTTDNSVQPLILIDNVQGDLSLVAPEDIESVDVLKDAAATSIYGSRGTHGVILVTTKRGKDQKGKLSFQAYTSFTQATKFIDVLNREQYIELREEAFANEGEILDEFSAPDLFLPYDANVNTNWAENIFKDAVVKNYNLSFSGGSNGINYFISGGYRDEESHAIGDFGLERFNMRANIDAKVSQKLSVGASLAYTSTNNRMFDQFLTPSVFQALPMIPFNDEFGNTNLDIIPDRIGNPNRIATQYTDIKSTQFLGSVYIDYSILDNLNFHTDISFSTGNTKSDNIRPTTSDRTRNDRASASFNFSDANTFNIEPRLTYTKQVNKNLFTALLGGTYLSNDASNTGINIINTENPNDNLNTILEGEVNFRDYNESPYRFNSVFGRLNYDYNKTYFLQASIRRDGSSRFGDNNRFGNFWSVGGSWIVSEEAFAKDLLGENTFLKLYSSYGTTGTDAVGNFNFLSTSSSPFFGGYNDATTLQVDRIANPDLKWEETSKFNVGLTLNTWRNRLNINLEYYRSITTDMLFNSPISNVAGFSRAQVNLDGEVENKGIELSVTVKPIQTDNFLWSSTFTISTIKNELLSLPNIEFARGFVQNRFKVGETLERIAGYNFLGTDPDTGIPSFEDLGEPGLMRDSEDYVTIGKTLPDNYGSWLNTFTYKGLDLTVQAQFVNGVDKTYGLDLIGGDTRNTNTLVLDRWQQPGDITDIPRASLPGSEAYTQTVNLLRSSFAYDDASYIRIKNITLGYTLPKLLGEKIDNLRLYATGYNLFTITDFKGGDPETGGTFAPMAKSFTLGLNLSF
ncbi:TonB-dependent receptor [uncultured Algibacter sp.]|uniref:SusC/RagA family TonB-linked outer membrane protein n=1 Tax=uncultured Algibacter sp. TaxID=298659 RepID=UPI0026331590|nr:TonB-dependent receptor [uncultured Algibacter sp.]